MKKTSLRTLLIMMLLIILSACTITDPAADSYSKTAIFETALFEVLQSVTPPAPTPIPQATPTITEPERETPSEAPTAISETTEIPEPSQTDTPEPEPTETSSEPPEEEPSVTPTEPSGPINQEGRERIRDRMQAYGDVDSYYLTDEYWELLQSRINTYGTTRSILTLEYHGDDYTMYEGWYSMSPDSFREQVDYLMAQDYHFATMHEIEGFVQGWLELPTYSVIMTTDISDLHVSSLLSIANTFSELETSYGYRPHMLAFIWTGAMDAGECSDNTCWQTLNQANQTGFFTFGSHSYTHRDFGEMSATEGEADLLRSINQIEDNMGLLSYTLAWPFETCSPYPDSIAELGITLAWGGSTKPIPQNFTAWRDARPLCLPRLLPPNIEGISMRPDGFTLQQMLDSALITP